MSFSTLQLQPNILQALSELQYRQPTQVQAEVIPLMLAGHEVLAKASTGSGKTAAFAIPILNQIDLESKEIQCIVICPTRELSNQVAIEIRRLGSRMPNLKTLTVTGGHSTRDQVTSIDNGVQVLVGTPGRLLDLCSRGILHLDNLANLILDEGDKLLELGFQEEILKFISMLNKETKVHFFSATFSDPILQLSRRVQTNSTEVMLENSSETQPDITQIAYELVDLESKANTLLRILQQHPSESTLIFCETKHAVTALLEFMTEMDISCVALHGDLEQVQREKVLALFRNGSRRILIGTDIASRGIDIPTVDLVINYDLPRTAETYTHRIGRTARAGRSGVAVSLLDARQELRLLDFEKETGGKILRQSLGFKNQFGLKKELRESKMKTLSISGGRKQKLRPGDILGAITAQSAGIDGSAVGKIEVMDFISYVAISEDKANQALNVLRNSKIKGHKFQVRLN